MAERLRTAGLAGKVAVVPLEGGGHHVPMEKLAPMVWTNFSVP